LSKENRSQTIFRFLLLILVSLSFLLFNISCAYFFTGKPQEDFKPALLTTEEASHIDRVWKLSDELLSYDYYAWVGSDSARKYPEIFNPENIDGYVVCEELLQTVVIFGKLTDSGLVAKIRVPFKFEHPGPANLTDTIYDKTSNAYSGILALTKTREIFRSRLDSMQIHINQYLLFHGDTIIAYLIPPGSDKKVYYFGGSSYASFDKNSGKLIRSGLLHNWYVKGEKFKNAKDIKEWGRTSLATDYINEADLVQSILNKEISNQFIITRKHLYEIEFDPTTRELSKFRVLNGGLLKK